MGDDHWCLMESDPGVFTDLIRNFGVSGVQVEELYALDEQSFAAMRPVFGLIFLYKWRSGDEPMGRPVYDAENIYFAQQVITNACATQAIINMLLNVEHPDVTLGTILSDFKSFSKDFDPANRGLVLSNAEAIRTVHNSYSRPQMFEMMTPQSKDEDAFHFVTYVPIRGKVYELDGLRDTPLELGAYAEGQDWLEVVRPIIDQRIAKYSEGEIHFNLMAVVKDKKAKLMEQMKALTADQDIEMTRLQMELEAEEANENRWKLENRRRRHNYIPFIVELLKVLAKENQLVPLVEEAIEKKKREDATKKEKETTTASS